MIRKVSLPRADVSVSRRELLKSAVLAVPWFVPARTFGANERPHVGVIGCGVRGKYLIANLPAGARVVSLCDCAFDQVANTQRPQGEFARPLARFADTDAKQCSAYQDYRRMLERERLDAVIIAAPDHHHALATILACQAGLDVYVEKPLSLTISEGRAMVEAAGKYQRVVQVGSQQRTMQVNRFACEFVRHGGLGQVSRVRLPNFPGPLRYDNRWPEETPPSNLAWDLFCGPAELLPHHKMLWVKDAFQYGYLTWRGWDLYRNYSGHLMTNWGAHSIDMVQYALGMDDSGPVEMWPERELLEEWETLIDDRWHDKTPPLGALKDKDEDRRRFCPVSLRYASGTLLQFDPSVKEIVFQGERGQLFLTRNNYRSDPADLLPPPDPAEQKRWAGAGHVARPHLENWLTAVRARSVPNAPLEVGHRTATICHLANITRELGRPLRWDPQAERFSDEVANALLQRPRRKGFELPPV